MKQRNGQRNTVNGLSHKQTSTGMQYSIDSEVSKSLSPDMKPSKFYNNAIMHSIEKTNSVCSTEREQVPLSYRNSCFTNGSIQDETISPRGDQRKSPDSKNKRKKINIRTLDMLIVYVERIITILKTLDELQLTKHQRE